MIKPTVGRVVWYWPTSYDATSRGMFVYDNLQPCAATVCYVHSDRMVNLSVADHMGEVVSVPSVTLLQDGDDAPSKVGKAEWMPYQKGQAANAENVVV